MTLRSLFTASAMVTAGMLFGRLLGLLREMLLASVFGVSHEADIAIMLLIIPDFITGALLTGAASATLVPAFAARTRELALVLMWQVLGISVAAFSAFGMLIFVFDMGFSHYLSAHLSAIVLLVFLCALPLTAITAIITAWLQYRGRFTVIGFANSIFNGVVVLALLVLPVQLSLLAGAIMVAALVRLLVHLYSFYRAEESIPKVVLRPSQLDKKLLINYIDTAGTGLFSMIPHFAPYGVIAFSGAGVAIFNYAFKLVFVPAMLGQGVIQMVLLPWLVQFRKSNSDQDAHHSQQELLQCAWGLSLAMCLSLSLASHDIVRLCFGYGKMTDADVDAVGAVFSVGVWVLPGILLTTVWQQIMYAHGNTRLPLLTNMLLAACVVPACWLGKILGGLEGVAFMYALIYVLPVLWLSYDGLKQGMIARYRPSKAYHTMTLATLSAWLPMAWLFNSLALPALGGLVLAAIIGILTLLAGAYSFHPAREWLMQRLKKQA